MKRRKFLKIAGSGITLSPWLAQLVIAADDSTADGGVLDDSTNAAIRSLFESNSEEALALTETVFRKCILEKIMPPMRLTTTVCDRPLPYSAVLMGIPG